MRSRGSVPEARSRSQDFRRVRLGFGFGIVEEEFDAVECLHVLDGHSGEVASPPDFAPGDGGVFQLVGECADRCGRSGARRSSS